MKMNIEEIRTILRNDDYSENTINRGIETLKVKDFSEINLDAVPTEMAYSSINGIIRDRMEFFVITDQSVIKLDNHTAYGSAAESSNFEYTSAATIREQISKIFLSNLSYILFMRQNYDDFENIDELQLTLFVKVDNSI